MFFRQVLSTRSSGARLNCAIVQWSSPLWRSLTHKSCTENTPWKVINWKTSTSNWLWRTSQFSPCVLTQWQPCNCKIELINWYVLYFWLQQWCCTYKVDRQWSIPWCYFCVSSLWCFPRELKTMNPNCFEACGVSAVFSPRQHCAAVQWDPLFWCSLTHVSWCDLYTAKVTHQRHISDHDVG